MELWKENVISYTESSLLNFIFFSEQQQNYQRHIWLPSSMSICFVVMRYAPIMQLLNAQEQKKVEYNDHWLSRVGTSDHNFFVFLSGQLKFGRPLRQVGFLGGKRKRKRKLRLSQVGLA